MIIVTGSIAYDNIMEFPGKFGEHILPEHTHNINLSFIVNKFAKHRGGTAGNVAFTLGLLKTPQVLFSFAGRDFEEYRNEFKHLGIDTSQISIDQKKYTATAFGMTDAAHNQIWGFYDGASVNNSTLNLEQVAIGSDLVLIGPQGVDGTLSFIRQCIDLKIPYMLDPGFVLTQITDKDLALGITHADYIIGNEYEVELIAKRVPEYKSLIQDKVAITTLGAKGAIINSKGKIYNIPPVNVQDVLSTTGAGDAWRGGFLAGHARDLDLQICGQMGAVASSFAVEHFGTQEHSYSLGEFKERYRQTYNSLLKLEPLI